MTQRELALAGEVSPAMARVAEREGLAPETTREGLSRGTICIPANVYHRHLDPCGIGRGLRTKVNANIGTSSDYSDPETELLKLRI
ncbi:MAG: phosphomethylpyrimidine synthase ThiC, partial [Chloroflexi bacterium]|nr:phosphomethylpyrimidine synthase ThiC [Chloroflexota bacterium]